jgi:hypothetical protein
VINGKPGRYTITPLPGSPRITGLNETRPDGAFKASVTGSGSKRVLHYDVGAPGSKKVTFFERGGATFRQLGKATGGKGTIRFSPGVGPAGKRKIVAQTEVDGVAIPDRVLATFRAGDRLHAGRPGRIHLRHRKTTLFVSWGKAKNAGGYGIVVKQANGDQKVMKVRANRRSARFHRVSRAWKGTVKVTAVGLAEQWGGSRTARFKATRKPPTQLRDFNKLGRKKRK